MKRLVGVAFSILMLALGACQSASTASRDADAASAEDLKPKSQPPAPKVTLPSGTPLRVVLQQGVGSDVSTPGSSFSAVLAEPVVIDGRTVLEKGSPVVGHIVDVRKAGRVKGRASVSLVLTSVQHDGEAVSIETKTYVGVAKSNQKRDAALIGGAAGVGAVIGAIAGGGKGAATGAAIGGAGGTGTVLATRGDDLHYPSETRLNFVLSKAVDL